MQRQNTYESFCKNPKGKRWRQKVVAKTAHTTNFYRVNRDREQNNACAMSLGTEPFCEMYPVSAFEQTRRKMFTSSSPSRKDQFAVSYFSTCLIVLIQVYNWEIRHHSLVCCCELADILYIFEQTAGVSLCFKVRLSAKNTPCLQKLHNLCF